MYSLENKRVWVAGHRGMVGSALMRRLMIEGCTLITASRDKLDLRRQEDVETFVRLESPDIIIMAAAKVGGILANATYPAEFLYDNLAMELNVTNAAFKNSVERYLFLGSSCIYPKFADQPIVESALLTGALEPTNEWYAVAKIAGLKLAQSFRIQYGADYISAMPTNLYGPGDNFDLAKSHVLPALIRKAHEAKLRGDRAITVWGTGTPRREFLYSDDCADALVYLLKYYSGSEHVNVGAGEDLPISELTELVCEIVGFGGVIEYDSSKPDGTPRKLMDSSKLFSLGWRPRVSLADGIRLTYEWYLSNAK